MPMRPLTITLALADFAEWALDQESSIDNALAIQAERLRESAAQCLTASQQPQVEREATPGTMDITPTPRGFAGMAAMFTEQAEKVEALRREFTARIEAIPSEEDVEADQATEAATRQVEAQAVLERVKARIEGKKYDLTYLDYNDELRPEQVETLLTGENIYESDEWSTLIENIDENRRTTAIQEAQEACEDDEWDILESAGLDVELVQQVEEQDDTDWVERITGKTRNLLFRYSLDWHVASSWADSEEQREATAREIAEVLGLPFEGEVRENCLMLCTEASYGGNLTVIWYGNAEEAIKVATGPDGQMGDTDEREVGTLTFTNVMVLVHDGMNGSGMDARFPSITVPWYTRRVHTDVAGPGYSWTTTAGPYEPAYSTTITMTPTPAEV